MKNVINIYAKYNICKKRWRNKRVLLSKQKASFVYPSTKEQQRKPLVNLKLFPYVISQKRRENRQKKYGEMFSYQFVTHIPKIRQI